MADLSKIKLNGNEYDLKDTVARERIEQLSSHKPTVIWEVTDVSLGLKALQTDITANPTWQLTDLDFSPYKRIKIYAAGGQGQTNAGTTGGMILEMSLDPRMAVTSKGGHYVGSVLSQKPNDANRYASLTCAVSADKTAFCVLRQTSLYGTAATTNNDIGANVVLIEGYYDDDGQGSPNSSSEVSGDTDLSDYLKKSDLAAWAKSANKPTYTASEVGALPDTTVIPPATTVTQILTSGTIIATINGTDIYAPAYLDADEKGY